ncbi:hypothetical protein EHS11_03680 [Leptospira ilyithenensis]|uniref:Uncharacterized protein n=2 Tax=Leptospira ilyithenensis TaxID=2484901 RepID=A0A4R9LWE5_9LEPT|nr:hypothetical protein EHS11_03680 [Leptospira ilyithenensis]
MLIEFGKNSVTHTISENAKKIAIGWEVSPGMEGSMQVVQLDSRGQSLKSSIIYDLIYGSGFEDQKQNDRPIIRIQNLADTVVPNHSSEYLKKLEITGITFAVREDISGQKSNSGDRPTRSLTELACSNPLLAFFDFLFVNACEKVGAPPAHNIQQHVPDTGDPVYVSGSYPNQVQVDDKPEQNPADEFSLRRVVSSENVNLVAAVTTSVTCRVPYREVIAHRKTREDDESVSRRCIRNSLDLITSFVQLFWGRISTMFADRTTINDMVQNILGGRGTGQPSSSSQADPENQLISSVQELTRDSGDGGREARYLLSSAVQVSRYWEAVQLQDYSEEQRNDVRNEFIQRIDTNFASADSQDLYIGDYELDMSTLTNWVRPDQIPQVLSANNQWRSSPERFTSDIVYSRDFQPGVPRSPFLNDVISILEDWDAQYLRAAGMGGLSKDKKSYYSSASWLAKLFREWTDSFDSDKNLILIVTYFKNRPVSLLLGSMDSPDRVAELQLTLSSPYDVVEEYRREGFSIRGGGTQMMRLYLEEMKKKGVVLIVSDVVTQASARLQLRWGFLPAFAPYANMTPSPPSPFR